MQNFNGVIENIKASTRCKDISIQSILTNALTSALNRLHPEGDVSLHVYEDEIFIFSVHSDDVYITIKF